MNTGGVTSAIHLTVRDVVEVLRQASVAVNVLVCERLHPLLTTAPSDEVIVGAPQASVAVAVPSEPSGLDGLQPRIYISTAASEYRRSNISDPSYST